jgi:hypothetical protein
MPRSPAPALLCNLIRLAPWTINVSAEKIRPCSSPTGAAGLFSGRYWRHKSQVLRFFSFRIRTAKSGAGPIFSTGRLFSAPLDRDDSVRFQRLELLQDLARSKQQPHFVRETILFNPHAGQLTQFVRRRSSFSVSTNFAEAAGFLQKTLRI